LSRGERREYDLVAIGAGPAGQSAAELASFFGYRTVIVEKNKPGGVVSTTGGAPTKTLREAMLAMTGFHNREIYGITVATPPHVVFQKIIERTKQVIELMQSATTQNISRNNVEYLQGTARIGSDHTVVVTPSGGQEQVFSARAILVATGSCPLRPRSIPFDDPDVWDTDEFFSRGRLPRDLFIVGGGPIGVEFATVFAGLDVKTTVSDAADRLLPSMDGEISN
jgi:NAD(P) transhydrogenase